MDASLAKSVALNPPFTANKQAHFELFFLLIFGIWLSLKNVLFRCHFCDFFACKA